MSWVEPEEIDQIDILNSRIKAMKQAAEGLVPGGRLPAGGWQPGPRQPLCHSRCHRDGGEGGQPLGQHRRGIHLAKVSRDRYMEEMAQRYPQYEFQRHRAIPPSFTMSCCAVRPCPIHRRTF
ncbi:MAG: hypothetical protein ACLRWQ_12870 [Flavonifractor plautii]